MLSENEIEMLNEWFGEDIAAEKIAAYPDVEKKTRAEQLKAAEEIGKEINGNVFFRLGVNGNLDKIKEEFAKQGVKICDYDSPEAQNADGWCIAKIYDRNARKAKIAEIEDEFDRMMAGFALNINDLPPYELRSPLLSKENAGNELKSALGAIIETDGNVRGMPMPIYAKDIFPLLKGDKDEYENRAAVALENMGPEFKDEFEMLSKNAVEFQDFVDSESVNYVDDTAVYRGCAFFDNPYGISTEFPARSVPYATRSPELTQNFAEINYSGLNHEIKNQQPFLGIIYKYKADPDQKLYDPLEIEGSNLSGLEIDESKRETLLNKEKNPVVAKFLKLPEDKVFEVPEDPKWDEFLTSIKTYDVTSLKYFPHHHEAALKNDTTYDYFTSAQKGMPLISEKVQEKAEKPLEKKLSKADRLEQLRGLGNYSSAPRKAPSSQNVNLNDLKLAKIYGNNY